jgi:hypothetical protein
MPLDYSINPDWYIQGDLLGRQVTTAIPFPTTSPFLSQPGAYYFGETGHSVRSPFLDFWVKCDGLRLLGYPISDQVYEVLTPGQQPYQVQYFERGRLEYHQDDPVAPVQFGLLGLIKSKDPNFRPNIVMEAQASTSTSIPAITPIPSPAVAPTPIPAATPVPGPTVAAYP